MTVGLDKRVLQTTKTPFQVYLAPPSDPPDSADWRTFVVRTGTVTNLTPDNDDASATPLRIVVPTSTTEHKVWLECDVDTDGTIQAVTVDEGATGWSGFPDQPDSPPDGTPPDTLYVLLARITTGVDSPNTAPTYQYVKINQYILNSLWAQPIGHDISCDPSTGFVLILAMNVNAI
jgi:hypothetical protein